MAYTLAEARAAERMAAMAKEDLIKRSLEGEGVTDDEMLQADIEHDQALRLVKLIEETTMENTHAR